MTDLADKIYDATGLTLNAVDVEAIGRMITQGRNDALEEVVVLLEDIAVKTINGEYEARLPRCVVTISDCLAKIRALKGAAQ
jgi:hypothetical protein